MRTDQREQRRAGITVWVAALVLGAVVLAVYWPALRHGLVWDDRGVLEGQLPYLTSVADFFVPPPAVPELRSHYYRPLIFATYKFDLQLAATFWPQAQQQAARVLVLHASVIVYHLLATWLVFLFALELMRTTAARRATQAAGRAHVLPAALAALIFALHPTHAESVAWIAGRSDVVCAVCFFGALVAYTRHRRSGSTLGLVLAATLTFAALLAKEVALALFVLLPAIDLWLHQTRDAAPRHRPAIDSRKRWIVLALPLIAYAGLRALVAVRHGGTGIDTPDWTRLPGALGWLVAKTFWPAPQAVFVGAVPGGAFAVGGGVAIAASVVIAVALSRRPTFRRELVPFVLWISTLVPSLAIALVPVAKTPLAERYLYLPSAGAALFAVLLTERVLRPRQTQPAGSRNAVVWWVLLVIAGAALGLTTRSWLPVWNNDASFWPQAALQAPQDPTAHLMLGNLYATKQRDDDALIEFRTAADLFGADTGRAKALNNVATILIKKQRHAEAVPVLRDAATILPGFAAIHHNLAIALLFDSTVSHTGNDGERRRAEARHELETAIALKPAYPEALYLLGQLELQDGNTGSAAEHLRRSIALAPAGRDAADARRLLGEIADSTTSP